LDYYKFELLRICNGKKEIDTQGLNTLLLKLKQEVFFAYTRHIHYLLQLLSCTQQDDSNFLVNHFE